MSDTEFTRDELYSLATEAEITGRGDMNKAELREALTDEAPHLLHPFAEVLEAEVGDTVRMNHLKSELTITEQRLYTGDGEVVQITEDDRMVHDTEAPAHTVTVLRTPRGGRHAVVTHKDSETGPAPWTNGAEPHLRRWRAGDEEWMNNSTDPVFFRLVTDDEVEEDPADE